MVDEAIDHMNTTQNKIRKLDISVVNRIAAGEIIIQPANALKEMLENSIDAQSTTIDVLAKDGGLKLLQIVDNGIGIYKEDLGLLCERFATSKIKDFNDLSSISTYGFRGEALASISHISHLSVVAKVESSPLAYKAYYLNGKLCSSKFKVDSNNTPKPVAGKNGTQITVEDLFYNSPSRLRALKSKHDEWAKILDVIGRYAVHTDKVGISCKKFGEPLPAIATRPGMSLKERVRTVFGVSVASDLIEFQFPGSPESETDPEYGLIHVRGAVSGFNYSNKRKIPPVFFINNRLVSCDPLARAINSVFQYFLPKGTHPFIYLSLNIVPQNLDVNIHPTKREVRFLFEDEIIEWICGKVHDVLSEKDGSRTFKQSTLKRQANTTLMDEVAIPSKVSRQEHKLVRVDANQSKINQFVKKDFRATIRDSQYIDSQESTQHEQSSVVGGSPEILGESQPADMLEVSDNTQTGRDAVDLNLDSVLQLRNEVSENIHRALTNVFSNSVYVGLVDTFKRVCCFQYDVKLFLCDYGAVLAAHLYQRALFNIGNYGEYVLEKPLPLEEILQPLYQNNENLEDMELVISRLMSMEEMFEEYFQMSFKGRTLRMLPLISQSLQPSQEKLAHFIYRLGNKVNYGDEKECLRDVMKQIALFYIPDKISVESPETGAHFAKTEEINSILEHEMFPELRKSFIASEDLLRHVVQVADLPGLYKVFERC